MSDPSKGTGSSVPNIFSVNKNLTESLADIDFRFTTLNKIVELGHSNTSGRMENIENRLDKMEQTNSNMEKILLQLQKTLCSQTPSDNNQKESKEVEKLPKGKLPRNSEDNLKTIPKEEKNRESILRDNLGRIQFSDHGDEKNLTQGEKFVKRAWPEAVFPNDIQDAAYTSVKNKVVLKPEWRLIVANGEVFNKLHHIQNALQMALVPYYLWASRVTIDMSGDFHGVRVWASGKKLSWIQLLEAIFTTMQRLNVLNSPFTAFSLITPKKEESPHDFAWRLRDAFYQLSGTDRESDSTRELLKELIMSHLPRVWTLAFPNIKASDNYEIIEMTVQIAAQVIKWSSEVKMLITQKPDSNTNIIPYLESPSFNTSEELNENFFVTKDNNCYTCGKKGHWANECPKTRFNNHYKNNNTSNNKSLPTWNKERITKPNGKYDELKRKLSRFRNSKFQNQHHSHQKPQSSYLINDTDIEQQQIDPITKLEDNDFEQDLNTLLDELDHHEQEE